MARWEISIAVWGSVVRDAVGMVERKTRVSIWEVEAHLRAERPPRVDGVALC